MAACTCAVIDARADSLDARVEALFRPPLGERMTLSPDGQRVAYTTQSRGALAIVITPIEQPGPTRTVPVTPERTAASADDQPATQLRFLRWATNERLIYAPAERIVPLPPIVDQQGQPAANPDGPTILSPILAADADGKQRGTLIDARDFQELPSEARRSLGDLLRTPKELAAIRNEPLRWRMPRLEILGFHPRDREQLIIGTSGAYSMPMQHLLDIRAGSVREFGGDWPVPPSAPQIYDWYRLKVVGERRPAEPAATLWSDADLARVQQELTAKFPRRVVELIDWSETRSRVLFRVTGGRDPGRVFVFQRPEDLVVEIFQRAPWLTAATLNETRSFHCASPDGAQLTGDVTWPAKTRLAPPPVLVVFPSGFPGEAPPSFDPEAQIFADLGFAVVRLNHRRFAGRGPAGAAAWPTAPDRIVIGDVSTAMEWIAAQSPERAFDRKRVATFGRGLGGYLALRAVQLQPALFRGAIAIDAPVDLRPGAETATPAGVVPSAEITRGGAATPMHAHTRPGPEVSLLGEAETLANPVFLLVEPGGNPAIAGANRELHAKLSGLDRAPEYFAIEAGSPPAPSSARAAAYRKIDAFLHLNLNRYAVKVGPAAAVK